MSIKSNLVVFKAFGDEEGSDGQNVDITQTPEFQAALEAKLAEEVEKATSTLKTHSAKVLDEKKKVQEQLNRILAQAEDEKDQAALKAGEIDMQTLIDKRVAAAEQTWQERLAEREAREAELLAQLEERDQRFKQHQIQQQIGSEALKNEYFHPTALEDLMMHASSAWELTESGNLVMRDKHGNIVSGKSGAPLTPKEWIEGLAKTKPHYFKQMPGSGGKQGAGGGTETVTRAEWQKMMLEADKKQQQELLSKRAAGSIVIQ